MMKKLIFLLLSFSLITVSEAHSGRTDAYGGHNDEFKGKSISINKKHKVKVEFFEYQKQQYFKKN